MRYAKDLFFLAVIVLLLLTRNCGKEVKTKTVIIPQKEGVIEKVTEVKYLEKTVDSIVYKDKVIYTESKVNKEIANEYLKTKDSLERLKMFLNAIQEEEVINTFDDEHITLDIYTKTQGKLLDIKTTYTVKEYPKEIKIEENLLYVGIGGGLKYTTTLEEITPTINIAIMGKKQNITTLQYGLDKSIQINYTHKIFNIKK